jgi:hypothetical protein
LARFSEELNNAAWTGFNSTVTANTTISPDGTQNADTVVYGSSGYLYQDINIVSWSSVTISIFSKTNSQCIVFGGATPSGTDTFTTIAYANGWYRQILTRVFTSSATGIVQFLPFGNNTTLYLWGAQIEQSSYPTSYIKTTSTSVTRLADSCSKTGISSLIGQTSGSIFWDIQVNLLTGNEDILNIDNGSFGNTIYILKTSSSSIVAEIYVSGSAQCNFSYSITTAGRYKIVLTYTNNDFAFYVNGISIGTDTSGSVPTTSRLQLGNGALGSSDGKTNQLLLFQRVLTSQEAIALTTI